METKKLLEVNSKALLKSMEKAGFIKLHRQTGEMVYWNGRKFKTWYVDDGDSSFTFRDQTYRTIYKSGSFYPYVYAIVKK